MLQPQLRPPTHHKSPSLAGHKDRFGGIEELVGRCDVALNQQGGAQRTQQEGQGHRRYSLNVHGLCAGSDLAVVQTRIGGCCRVATAVAALL